LTHLCTDLVPEVPGTGQALPKNAGEIRDEGGSKKKPGINHEFAQIKTDQKELKHPALNSRVALIRVIRVNPWPILLVFLLNV
jgi:hypothetical protein